MSTKNEQNQKLEAELKMDPITENELGQIEGGFSDVISKPSEEDLASTTVNIYKCGKAAD